MKTITVDDMVKDSGRALELDVRMGEGGLRHPISVMKVLKPGLILANLVQKHETDELVPDQVVVFGGQEMDFVASLPEADRLDLYRLLFQSRVSCLVVTRNQPLPAQMLASAAKERIPILHTALSSGEFIEACETWLERAIQPSDNRHGEMVDVHGVGIYIFGRSGIGVKRRAVWEPASRSLVKSFMRKKCKSPRLRGCSRGLRF